jgi:hypothetical protein
MRVMAAELDRAKEDIREVRTVALASSTRLTRAEALAEAGNEWRSDVKVRLAKIESSNQQILSKLSGRWREGTRPR